MATRACVLGPRADRETPSLTPVQHAMNVRSWAGGCPAPGDLHQPPPRRSTVVSRGQCWLRERPQPTQLVI